MVVLSSSGETLKGSILVSDMDAYQFYGEAGDRAIISAVTTSGLLNTEIILVDPDFVNETNTQPGGDLLDHELHPDRRVYYYLSRMPVWTIRELTRSLG